jgi:hypothetical protein
MIELIPNKKDDLPTHHQIEWYAKYIYPTELNGTIKEKIEWAEWMRCNWKTAYPELSSDYKFGRILYWHLSKSHCYLIKRDREWFKRSYPKFKEFWDQVIELRNDPIKKQELIDKIAHDEINKMEKKLKRAEIKVVKENINYANMFDSDSD